MDEVKNNNQPNKEKFWAGINASTEFIDDTYKKMFGYAVTNKEFLKKMKHDLLEWFRMDAIVGYDKYIFQYVGTPGVDVYFMGGEDDEISETPSISGINVRVTDVVKADAVAQKTSEDATETPKTLENSNDTKATTNVMGLKCFADIQPEEVRWISYPYIPKGKIVLLAAHPGSGKTWVCCKIAACLSKGEKMPWDTNPFDEEQDASNVIYLTAEDGLADTIRVRLDSCGANVENVYTVVDPNFGLDDERLERMISEYKPSMIIIDPLQGFVGEKTDVNAMNQIRYKFKRLIDMGEKYKTTFLIVCHLNKNSGGESITRIIGSMDIVATARGMLMIGNVPNQPGIKYLSHEKSSLAEMGNTILFNIDDVNGGIVYQGECELKAVDFARMEPHTRSAPVAENAKKFLKEFLADGTKEQGAILKEAAQRGISKNTLYRVKAQLGIKGKTMGFGAEKKSIWYMAE